jgi:YD repeat-containing protein
MNDPDMGTWTYSYNALGKLVSQTDAKGQTSTMVYDKLGRMIRPLSTFVQYL